MVSNKDSASYDVAIIGGGNAALCAAMTAAESGARVIILEGAPKIYRGGNSRHTRNFRCMHDGPLSVLTGTYDEDEYYDDLIRVTGGKTDEVLARMAIRQSKECLPWMIERGVRFQPSLSGTLSLARTNAFFMGGGKALVNAYYRTIGRLGVDVLYEAQVTHLDLQGDRIEGIDFSHKGVEKHLTAKAVIVAAGGFQANLDWLAEAWGPPARNFLIRGTPYNTGVVLKDLLDQGVESVGDPTQCHAVAIDGRAPKFDGGIVTRLDCVPFSVVVNNNGQRFYDEGEDVWPKRYAIWGRLIAAQPDQVGYVIIDSKSLKLFMPSVFPPIEADTLPGLIEKMGLPLDATMQTLQDFNAACGDTSGFHPTELDGVTTKGLQPQKTNWARPIAEPPFYGYSLRTGVTFTYLGLKVDENAQCSIGSAPVVNMWAAGETIAGSILGQGYLAGYGMTIGTVFGRIAGREAAKYVN
ncbi:FAD-dependent tricarballylate dehydrogenase TcuA [Ahrensia kielensis]|uniref:FAD-dependent tricarballylate dehydrogenase TcuA n=1 Tax=Ahrensia kielensis TaxID=76980 RepID=A0ABU9T3X2_9HYPH